MDLENLLVSFGSTVAAFLTALVLWETRQVMAAIGLILLGAGRWSWQAVRTAARSGSLRLAWWILRKTPSRPVHSARREEPVEPPLVRKDNGHSL